MEPQLPPPGWYRDPADAERRRYWDGAAWTQRVQVPVAQPPAVEPVQPVSAPIAPAEAPAAVAPAPSFAAEPAAPASWSAGPAAVSSSKKPMVVAGAVVGALALALLAGVTVFGEPATPDVEDAYDECGEILEDASFVAELEFQPVERIDVARHGGKVDLEFWVDDETGDRATFRCVVGLDDGDADVEELWASLDEYVDGDGPEQRFNSVGSSISG